jgi:hypothetical protein
MASNDDFQYELNKIPVFVNPQTKINSNKNPPTRVSVTTITSFDDGSHTIHSLVRDGKDRILTNTVENLGPINSLSLPPVKR